jgi:hypothetical protein
VTDAQLNLGPRANNGGLTPTMLPGAGSIAIDAIPTSDTFVCTGTDQRGVSRPQGPGCDIGAVEVASGPPEQTPEAPVALLLPLAAAGLLGAGIVLGRRHRHNTTRSR